jgi:TPP-dependent trihydroxycyclohexane-1,2-dione (THcHDO) dehydratase
VHLRRFRRRAHGDGVLEGLPLTPLHLRNHRRSIEQAELRRIVRREPVRDGETEEAILADIDAMMGVGVAPALEPVPGALEKWRAETEQTMRAARVRWSQIR